MYKKIFLMVITIIVLTLISSIMVLAAPDSLTGDEGSTAELVELSSPENNSSTYSNLCQFSGIAEQGVKITVYKKEYEESTYEKIIIDEEEVSWTVGLSGSFGPKEIELEKDKINKLLIYAEKNEDFQIIKTDITVMKKTLKDILKNGIMGDIISKIIRN